jgi:acyl transferase domain-containing protein/acyl carrier protein
MQDTGYRAVAIVGAGAVMPDAPNVAEFWKNITAGRYSIAEVPPDRWDPALFYDSDRSAPDKTYSKIGGWVRECQWEPFQWKLAIPPKVAEAMDDGQRWAIACTRAALLDYGYPERPLNTDRTAVILGNAMAGEKHYLTTLRAFFPEYSHELDASATFAALPEGIRRDITREWHGRLGDKLPRITEDSMPGELANCLAGRIANVFDFHGPNFVCDAACASTMAAVLAAVEGLVAHDFDVAVTGGLDRNMGAPTFVKFSKIGALSASGSRPYAEGADGFVMGEGAAIFVMKRLADAERDGDSIYAVVRGIGASSDGKGKGITAPNPVGQKFAVERAWENAGVSPLTATLIEGHGTSTSVGDVVEVNSMLDVLHKHGANGHPIALGSVKSNIGHLKGAAGAAGILKTALALRHKTLPPSVGCEHPNPNIDFAHSPLYVNREARPWTETVEGVRRAGASAFGFGGTNFHVVLEEHIPHRITGNGKHSVAVREAPPAGCEPSATEGSKSERGHRDSSSLAGKTPLRGALVTGAASKADLLVRLRAVQEAAEAGRAPDAAPPFESDLRAPERVAIDYGDAAELSDKCAKAIKALAGDQSVVWKALRAQGIYRGRGAAPKLALLYTGQGSQYVNMLRGLRAMEPIVAQTFEEADRIMVPLLGKPLSDFIFVDSGDPAAVAQAEDDLRQTAITQPAVLAADLALTRLLAAYGVRADMTMGHSLGEYGALVAAGGLAFADALEAVSARGREMTRLAVADNGKMAAVFAPIPEIERILKAVDGYVVIANLNSDKQAVIGGGSSAVEQATEALLNAGYNVVPLPVSHAFHTSIIAPAAVLLRRTLDRLGLQAPTTPVVGNVDGEFYPTGPDARARMLDILERQVASPVQFVKGLRTLYNAGTRVFVEVGPKKALHGFVEDVLGDRPDVVALFTNHPKFEDATAFNQALCGLYAAGLGAGRADVQVESEVHRHRESSPFRPVVITGASLGLPGVERVFDDRNVARILNGEQFIDFIPSRHRKAILDKHITRLVKSDNGGPSFEEIRNQADVVKLAARANALDLIEEFGIGAERIPALDRATKLAIGAGIDALRDAGIPLTMRYKTTSKGTRLPDRWLLPEALRDDTGIIFASVFPGYDAFADEQERYYADRARREQLAALEDIRARLVNADSQPALRQELERRITDLRDSIERAPYHFDRRFMFRILSMGHSQFAELIGARGPNTHINAACASTTQAVGVAEDWIRAGRCRRVIVVSADDITSDSLIHWFGAGFLATGAAATGDNVEEVAVPFDRRRNGMVIGMGAAAMVVESADAAAERGLRPICEVLGAVAANSAFHGTRLDVEHIRDVMENLVREVESKAGIRREEFAPATVFVSHETYTPARGGSASAEIHALRHVFGEMADRIVIANTKGFTGHAMGAGIEDVVAIKALETGVVPPVANFKEVDPELGALNLSRGGAYPVEYALRLGAGFGSQISMTLTRRVPCDGPRPAANALGYAYRIADRSAWAQWLEKIAGAGADLEVVRRTLRVRDANAAAAAPRVERRRDVEAAAPPPAPAPRPEPGPVGAVPQALCPTAAADPVQEQVLALVVEKTGYPREMLDLDLDLEADLGIDTVKQAEMFAAIRERYGIARDPNLKLREFATLARVMQFVYDHRPDLKSAAAAPAAQPVAVAAAAAVEVPMVAVEVPAEDAVRRKVLDLVVEKTGYPRDMLDLDLDLEADLGVDTVKQAEMFAAIREEYGIARDPNLKLREFATLARVIQFVYDHRPELKPATPPAQTGAVSPAAPLEDAVREKVLNLVVEKTGYPKDMLDPDLDLEADLGVDTVKQAEMFAAIRAEYGIERDPNLKLREFATLAKVIQFVYDRRPDLKRSPDPARVQAAPPAPAVAAAPPVAATVTAAPEQRPAMDDVSATVLAIVADKTGYPMEMLDLELDLEADLGIDTVKQAEMFAAVRGAFGIARDQTMRLRDFPTLGHIIRFAQERRAGVPTAPVAEHEEAVGTTATFAAAERVPRRVPAPVLRPALALCKATGVSIGAGTRIVVAPDRGGIGDALAEKLRALGAEVVGIEEAPAGPVNGVFWLPALDAEAEWKDMTAADWRSAVESRVKSLYRTMRSLYGQIAGSGTFLVSGTRLGGYHGYDDAGAVAPLGGAVTGFTKAYKRERPDALVKAVDFGADRDAGEIADLLLAEALRDPGAVEIGYGGSERWTVCLEERPVSTEPGMTLDANTVFVVTGAAGSIVSAITADLAAASGGVFHLIDVAPEPDPSNADLKRFATDKDGLKRDLFARIQARGERATPALVERELAGLERAHAAVAAIEAVRAAGGSAHYYSVDLTDGEAVAKAVAGVRERSGRIDVLLHAAGVDRSHALADKDEREFNLVFDVKSDGIFHLLKAIGDMPLRAVVGFSSIAGRFGNAGQTDYSSANDLLCKMASSFRRTRPETRAIAIDWTAWAGMGMAMRGSIPKVMQMAGIDMLPPEAGVPWIRRELTARGTSGEVLVALSLGALLKDQDATGGLDASRLAAGPMTGAMAAVRRDGTCNIETTLDPVLQPFLHDHAIDGTPVLPGVMGIEAFAEAAAALSPGWVVDEVADVNFVAPFKFYRSEPRVVTVEAAFAVDGEERLAHCRLIGTRVLPNQAEPQTTTHFTGLVRLAPQSRSSETGRAPSLEGSLVEHASIYGVYFHGPAYQVLRRAWWTEAGVVGEMAAGLPENHLPAELPLAMAPRLIELCFQTAGLWEMAVGHRMGLPQHVDSVRLCRTAEEARGPLYAVVTPQADGSSFDAEVVDAAGVRYVEMKGYRTVTLREGVELQTIAAAEAVTA